MEITKLPTCDECNEHPVVRFRCGVCLKKAFERSYLSGYQKGLKEAGRDRYRAIWVVAFAIACMVLYFLAFKLKH